MRVRLSSFCFFGQCFINYSVWLNFHPLYFVAMSLLLYSHYSVLAFVLLSSTLLSDPVLSQQDGDLRLSGYGASRLAGRLEVYLDHEWGTVCADDNWLTVAKVACRQLRLGHFIGHPGDPSLRYGIGNESILLEHVRCRDDDLHLLRCSHSRVGVNSSCDHHMDISVMCSGVLTPYEGEVRLVGGVYSSGGVAEVYIQRKWAPVCSTDMEPGLADTICRQLGYTGMESVKPLDNTTGPFWSLPLSPSSSALCSSASEPCIKSCVPLLPSSQSLTSCTGDLRAWQLTCGVSVSEFWNVTSGSHDLCVLNGTDSERGKVYLYGDDPEQGRVEVFLDNERASLMMLNSEGATVVCKHLGFPTFLFSFSVSSMTQLAIPPFQGPQYHVTCTGLETHIDNCTFSTSTVQNHDDDAYVHCSPILWPFGSLQLIGGAGPFGQLQVSPGQNFYWLCDAHFSMREATVACRQMGYNGANKIVRNSLLAPSVTSLLSYSFTCAGDEDYLLACQRVSVITEACREHLDVVAVQCGSSSSTEGWTVRLTPLADNDSNHGNISEGVSAGRVEVLLEEGGRWGNICASGFSRLSANVICRQLGFETFNDVTIADGDPTTPVLLSSVQCHGFEERLDYCPHVLSSGNCTNVISINCSTVIPYPDGTLRLVNSSSVVPGRPPQDGRLEISYHGLWMSVCGLLFTQTAADVACRQLGFQPAANYCQNACSGVGTSQIHFGEYYCRGNETGLLQCGINIYHEALCSRDNVVGLSCSPLPDVSLVESSSTSLPSSPSPNPSLSSPSSSLVTTGTPLQPSVSNTGPRGPVTPTEKNAFTSDGLFYVVACVVGLLILSVIVSVTICYVYRKKRESWDVRVQNGSYSDRNDEAISAGANGEMIREVAEGDDRSEFDFDAVTDSVEEKACAKAAEAMEVPPDRTSLSSSIPPPPQYHELDLLSHSIPGEEVKELS